MRLTDSLATGRQPFLHALLVVFSGTLAVQAVAFLRQLVIASAFGVDRAMDLYVLVFTVASVIGFSLGSVMENATVPLLVQRLEAADRAGFRQIALRVVIIGVLLGVAAAAAFLLAVPLVARYVTTGLSAPERQAMVDLSWWFTPWVLIATPYYAVGSILKAGSRFRRFMAAELLVTIVSLAVVLVWRPGVYALPLAYAAGYGAALLTMLPGLPVARALGERDTGRSWGVLRQIARFGAVSQIGALGALADRFLASHLPAGAIAAGSYAQLIAGQASALLSFREAFMVPLSEADRRAEKLERMIAGLLVLAVPCAIFLSARAESVVSVLLERGRFDRAAVALAAEMLALQAAAIPVGAVLLPVYRTLQIIGRMRFAGAILLFNALANLAIGSILMFGLGLGLTGYLAAAVLASHLTFAVAIVQLRIAGVRFGLAKPLFYAGYAAAASVAGLWLGQAVAFDAPRLVVLLKDAALFGVACLGAGLAIWRPLKRLVGTLRPAELPHRADAAITPPEGRGASTV
jgi:putative peptidoglycan lipid II flippase